MLPKWEQNIYSGALVGLLRGGHSSSLDRPQIGRLDLQRSQVSDLPGPAAAFSPPPSHLVSFFSAVLCGRLMDEGKLILDQSLNSGFITLLEIALEEGSLFRGEHSADLDWSGWFHLTDTVLLIDQPSRDRRVEGFVPLRLSHALTFL